MRDCGSWRPAKRRRAASQTSTANNGESGDPCALLFTSGTTGKPKCCVLSNDYFMRIADWYVSQGGVATMRDGEETVLTPLPMFHMNALACSTVGMILKGGAVVPLDRFHAQRWWRTVAEAGATVVHYLGVMPAILLKLDGRVRGTRASRALRVWRWSRSAPSGKFRASDSDFR